MTSTKARNLVKDPNHQITKSSRKLFEDFMRDAGKEPLRFRSKKKLDDMQNIYNAAQHLHFEKWVVFLNDVL
jgi:hypothetical protein